MTASAQNVSTVTILTNLLKSTLPSMTKTGLTRHLRSIKIDPKGKGKSVIFGWNKTNYRLTANLKVAEEDLVGWFKSEEAANLEKTLQDAYKKSQEEPTEVVNVETVAKTEEVSA